MSRLPEPPFPGTTAIEKAPLAQGGWNSRAPERLALAYGMESRWISRAESMQGHESNRTFPRLKWQHEFHYRLVKGLPAFAGYRVAVRLAAEWRDTIRCLRANRILHNAGIETPDRHQRNASGLAVADGTFIAAGSDGEVLRHVVDATTVIGAYGHRVIPGLIDWGMHVIRGGFNDISSCAGLAYRRWPRPSVDFASRSRNLNHPTGVD